MNLFEIIMTLISSGILVSIITASYKMGSYHKEMQLNFKHIDERFTSVESRFIGVENEMKDIKEDIREIRTDIREMRKDVSRLDREVGIITATLKFNGYDLSRHIAEGE